MSNRFIATLFDETNAPDKVTVAFTMADKAAEKGHPATLILMAAAVQLARPDAAAGLDIGAPFRAVPDLMQSFLAHGGTIAICKSCMIHNGLSAEQVDPRFPVITADEVVDLLMGAGGSLQLT